MFEQIAYFEAVAFEYWKSYHLEINDKYFNRSLEMLVAMNDMAISDQSISMITEYYKGMDYLIAEDFWKSHHHHSDWVRVGPFSVCDGNLGIRRIERPALVLNSKQQKEFSARVAEEITYNKAICKDLRNEPMVISFLDEFSTRSNYY